MYYIYIVRSTTHMLRLLSEKSSQFGCEQLNRNGLTKIENMSIAPQFLFLFNNRLALFNIWAQLEYSNIRNDSIFPIFRLHCTLQQLIISVSFPLSFARISAEKRLRCRKLRVEFRANVHCCKLSLYVDDDVVHFRLRWTVGKKEQRTSWTNTKKNVDALNVKWVFQTQSHCH